MFKFLLSLIVINVLLYGLGADWFGFNPSKTEIGVRMKAPTEIRPQDIQFTKE